MADYKQLLGKAIEALPENNGAARRQVYEKARNALVAQLRGIDPPLPSREITQHRLQLEDCIRRVEQAATDALLGVNQAAAAEPAAETMVAPAPEPTPLPTTAPEPKTEVAPAPAAGAAPRDDAKPVQPEVPVAVEPAVLADPEPAAPAPEPSRPVATDMLKTDVVGEPAKEAAPADDPQVSANPVEEAKDKSTQAAPVNAVEAAAPPVAEKPADAFAASNDLTESLIKEAVGTRRAVPAAKPAPIVQEKPAPAEPVVTKDQDGIKDIIDKAVVEDKAEVSAPAAPVAEVAAVPPVLDAPKKVVTPPEPAVAASPSVSAAMSEEREVDVDPASFAPGRAGNNDAQVAIDRAIQTLDREARGETSPNEPVGDDDASLIMARAEEMRQDREQDGRGGGGAVTIFLVVLALLLAGAGGAGYWAWKEGYIDVDALFGQSSTEVPDADAQDAPEEDGPGNTTSTPDAVTPVEPTLDDSDARLPATNDDAAGDGTPSATDEDNKSEERLSNDNSFGGSDSTDTATGDTAANGASSTGAQSLLLEASTEGTTGAVPYSGSVEWSRGTDEEGQPTLLAKANIPARSMSADILIRRNADPTLPASHLLEIDFTISDGFIGGGISSVPGILLKNEELVRGTPLFGASARVVGNSFLFALSAANQDREKNLALLRSRKWIDLALIYATSTRAIVTLEKDAAAQQMFDEVMAIWAEADAAAAPVAEPAPPASEGVTPPSQ